MLLTARTIALKFVGAPALVPGLINSMPNNRFLLGSARISHASKVRMLLSVISQNRLLVEKADDIFTKI